jgi:hypothetical protein
MSNKVSSGLDERIQWNGEAQARMHKYRRLIGVSKRMSIFLGKRFPNAFPLLFVLGHPKSGTSWMCQLLSDYLRLPFPQHSIMPLGCAAVLHSFEAPSERYRTGVYMVRDGRDTAVSTYFHTRGQLAGGNASPYHQRLFDGLDIDADPRDNMETFLKRLEQYPTGGWSKLPGWGDHVKAFFNLQNNSLCLMRFEELLADGEASLGKVIQHITGSPADESRVRETIDRFSFERQTGRKKGEENRGSYLRSGKAGDWVNHFSPAAAKYFDEIYGETLVLAGYESSRDWVHTVQ